MARIEKTVFISYRRTDVYTALAVYQDLASKGYDVFFDYTSISSGDFEQIILSNIKARAHFLLILTPTALDRCNEPADWLRREIEMAIDEKRNIVPLFFKGFNFGSPSVAEKLTGKLADLRRYNGLNVHEDYFHAAMDRLSKEFLNVPLTTVLHPVSTEVRKAVQKEQNTVNQAIIEKWEDLKELFKSADEKTLRSERDKTQESSVPAFTSGARNRLNLRLYGIGAGILLLAVAVIAATNGLFSPGNAKARPTITSLVVTNTISVESPLTASVNTATAAGSTSTPTEQPTLTVTPAPTLGIGSTQISPKDGMVMVYVPAGEFTMGLNGDEDDNPAHVVNLDSLWIDQTEITNAMYLKCDEENVCDPPRASSSRTRPSYYGNHEFDEYPVIHVSWVDAKSYCEWAGRRLPTEAEWEKAARGTDGRIYPWGNDAPTINLANFGGLLGDTTSVTDYVEGASPYRSLNMAGNVWEWVADFYELSYYGKSRASNPPGPLAGENRVMRGGSWTDYASTVKSTHRYGNYPLDTSSFIGFRCARSQ